MQGFAGNDSYLVDNAGDTVIETAGQGTDHVYANVNYTLAAGSSVEVLSTWGSGSTNAINLTGNEISNILQGNQAANTLNGGGGADIMQGFSGNDSYLVDNAGDTIIEAAGQGYDHVYANVNYALAAGISVEVLSTWGSGSTNAINLTGNEISNILQGNQAANTLNGGGGADIMQGFSGNDTFVFHPGEASGDTVIDFAGNGAAAGDVLEFVGYGPGAIFTQTDAAHGQVNYGTGLAQHDIITFANHAAIAASDVLFA
jgi:Ca2+-binding RTX toxin-like protein